MLFSEALRYATQVFGFRNNLSMGGNGQQGDIQAVEFVFRDDDGDPIVAPVPGIAAWNGGYWSYMPVTQVCSVVYDATLAGDSPVGSAPAMPPISQATDIFTADGQDQSIVSVAAISVDGWAGKDRPALDMELASWHVVALLEQIAQVVFP